MLLKVIVVALASVFLSAKGQQLCDEALLDNGIGYRYHPNDCSRYIQCHSHPDNPNIHIGVYKSCRFDYYWSQAGKECRPRTSVTNCLLEGCADFRDTSQRTMYGSGCRAYWQCENGNNVGKCCSPGTRFVQGSGCIADYTCADPCPGVCADTDACLSRPDWNSRRNYFHIDEDTLVYERVCPVGTHYDVLKCGCVSIVPTGCAPAYGISPDDIGGFFNARTSWLDTDLTYNGNSLIFNGITRFITNFKLPKPSSVQPLVIRFRFRQQTIQRPATLLTSTDCSGCNHLRIEITGPELVVYLQRFSSRYASISLSLGGFDVGSWKTVLVVYNGRELTAAIWTQEGSYMNTIAAPMLTVMDCGASFGSDPQRPFIGELERIAFYSCMPEGRILDILG